MRRRGFLGTLAAAAAAAACSMLDPGDGPEGDVTREGDMASGTGTVRHYRLEGGFFAIAGDDGTTYDPVDLPAEFRQDGLRVRFRVRILPDRMGIHMVGPIVEVVEISRAG